MSSLSVFARSLVASGSALVADDSNVKAATNQIESGARSSGETVILHESLQVTGDANGWVLRRMVKDGARGSS